jgi:hypothetical protein
MTRGEPAVGRAMRATTLYTVKSAWDSDHEAIIRFSGEAPRRRAHSRLGVKAMAVFGSPPPRTKIGGQSQCATDAETRYFYSLCGFQTASARNLTPAGISPSVTMRHKAIRSFRARATIKVVLRFPAASPVRARYHCPKALSF